jgi:GNAT superfamily N-acetyltransferase
MLVDTVTLLDESECEAMESFLADRIYEFNAEATGYTDGKLLAGAIRSDGGAVVAGFSGYTWGGCCEISYVWVHGGQRGRGLGTVLLRAAEREAIRRGCAQVVLMTHSFQAPAFYERRGYERRYAIEGRPIGHSDIVYVKVLRRENGM